MAITTIPWGDGSGDNIYLSAPSQTGDQSVSVTSDPNTGAARSKVVTFSASGVSPVLLTINQAAGNTYKSVEYIHASGGSCIDTGIIMSSTDKIIVTYAVSDLTASGDKYIIRCKDGYNGNAATWVATYGNNGRIYVRFGSTSSPYASNMNSYLTGKHTFELRQGWFGIDGSRILQPAYSSMPNTSMVIGGRLSTNNSVSTGYYGDIYEVSILDSDENYRFHGVPRVRLNDNEVGLYDTISGNFFAHIGSPFTAGPDV